MPLTQQQADKLANVLRQYNRTLWEVVKGIWKGMTK